jgi:xylose isomerase
MKIAPFQTGPCTLRSMPFWCVGNPLSDPFGSAVLPRIDSLEVARLLAEAARNNLIEATSFHDDDLVPWNPEQPDDDRDPASETSKTLDAIKDILDKAGLSVNLASCCLHGHPMFRRGGLTNPDPAIRRLARLKVERTIRIGHRFGARYLTYWVARDGFEVPAATDWKAAYDWLAEGLNHAREYIRRNRFTNYIGATIEPKPNEPRGHMFLPTAGHAVGFIQSRLRDPEFWGVNPELLQHESMALMNGVLTVAYLVACRKLAFLHFGSQIKAQFDNDFPPLVGPEGLKETVFIFHTLQRLGWKGVVEFDCHMLRTEGDPDDPIECRRRFIRHCVLALSLALELADRLEKTPMVPASETETDLLAQMALCGVSPKTIEARARKQKRS